MKIRHGFVSNSSSGSYIIGWTNHKDVVGAVEKFKAWYKEEVRSTGQFNEDDGEWNIMLLKMKQTNEVINIAEMMADGSILLPLNEKIKELTEEFDQHFKLIAYNIGSPESHLVFDVFDEFSS